MLSLKYYFKKFIKLYFESHNLKILNKNIYDEILVQRNKTFEALVSLEIDNLNKGLSAIIFSKDRAIQLYSLISSYKKMVSNKIPLVILYKASNYAHKSSYEALIKSFSKSNFSIKFIEQGLSFQNSIIKILDDIKTKNIFFLVDDNIFINKINLDFASNLDTDKFILSLRHSPNIKFSFTSNSKISTPKFKSTSYTDLLEFKWFEKNFEWSDPWSLDGHVLSTAEVKIISKVSKFKAPNSYENSLKYFNSAVTHKKGLCYKNSIILNLPINKVQDEYDNRSGSTNESYLLSKWNDGMMIDFSSLSNHVPVSTHELHSINFKKRNFEA